MQCGHGESPIHNRVEGVFNAGKKPSCLVRTEWEQNGGTAQHRLAIAKEEKQNEECGQGVGEQSRKASESAGRHTKKHRDSFLSLVHSRSSQIRGRNRQIAAHQLNCSIKKMNEVKAKAFASVS